VNHLAKKRVNADATLAGQLIAGTQKHFATIGQLVIAGKTVTPAQATTQLQAIVQSFADVDAARASLEAKLAAVHAAAPTRRVFLDAFVACVRAAFGTSPDVLADFGLKPKKARTPLTVEQKASAAAKRKATRAARHTMGSQQKKTVKGAVTGVVVTPVVAPTPVAPGSNGPSNPAPTGGGATTGTTQQHTA
jgi:hypothetical protein